MDIITCSKLTIESVNFEQVIIVNFDQVSANWVWRKNINVLQIKNTLPKQNTSRTQIQLINLIAILIISTKYQQIFVKL